MRTIRWLEWGAAVLVSAVLVGLPAGVFAYHAAVTAGAITVTGRIFESGGWAPQTITVEEGQPVRLRLTSHDVAHGFAIPSLGVGPIRVEPGKFTVVEFTASRAGTYPFMCTVVCSPGHGMMVGQLVVKPRGEAAAPALPTDMADQGATLYKAYCVGCHGLRGEGGVGPPLNASGHVPQMSDADLRRVIEEGRPDTPMPSWGRILTAEEIEALIRFLRTLGK